MASLRIPTKELLGRRHRWRRREMQRRFLIGYVGSAQSQSVELAAGTTDHRQFSAALFRLSRGADHLLLWVADQELGPAANRIEGVHAGTRADLWRANEEAIEWARLVEELGVKSEFGACATFIDLESAVGGLVAATLPSLPRNLGPSASVEERNFDLWDPALNRPMEPGVG